MKFLRLKKAEVVQPNKPKPTTTLPQNMEWSWDPEAADWVAVMKDNTNVTPPLYNPQNQNVVNQNTTSYMSNIKSASVTEEELYNQLTEEEIKQFNKTRRELLKNELEFYKQHSFEGRWDNGELGQKLKEVVKKINDTDIEIMRNIIENRKISSSCLSQFLDGPRYSKEIKIEAGLIKDGLVKYVGFDFNKGTKYAITTKGLELLRKASEAEHNEALNEREKLAYLFGFNTDEVSTLDTTGKVIKQSSKKWTICESDGTELGEVEADSELDAKVKFGIEHPEYADSQSICAKEVKSQYEQTTEQHLDYPNPSETPHTDVIIENHDGWVNTADQKRRPYTEEEKRLFPLFRLLNEYVAKKEITLEETPDNQPGTVATGQAEVINDLEHKVKDLGFYCEPIAEITDNDYIGADIYSLKIFYK